MSADKSPFTQKMAVRACLLGEKIDIKNIKNLPKPIATIPLTIEIEHNSYVVIMRYGAVVFFGVEEGKSTKFIEDLEPYISQPFNTYHEESNSVIIDEEKGDSITTSGNIVFKEFSVERLQICAEVLAKSVILNRYEGKISQVFENVEPIAENLKRKGKSGTNVANLNRQTGEVMLSMTKTIGRAELSEKPDVLWEHPELERLYYRLAEEYEIKERSRHLSRKQDIAASAITSFVDLAQHSHMSRLVWYVIILIVIAIAVGFI